MRRPVLEQTACVVSSLLTPLHSEEVTPLWPLWPLPHILLRVVPLKVSKIQGPEK